jgi:hypothetical protein
VAQLVVTSGFARFEVLIFRDGLSCSRKTKTNCFLAHRTGRKLLLGDEGHFMFAPVFFVPHEVETGLRYYLPRPEFFLWHILLERRGTDDILAESGVSANKNRKLQAANGGRGPRSG